jgi:hypothetical protein
MDVVCLSKLLQTSSSSSHGLVLKYHIVNSSADLQKDYGLASRGIEV